MSRAARSLFVFGVYLIGLAVALVVAPNVVLGIFGLPDTSEVWIRVLGVIAGNIGVYYVLAARHELRPIIVASIPIRFALMGFLTAFVVLDYVEPIVLVFGVADVIGAIWTLAALRRDRTDGYPSPRTRST